MLLQFLFQRFSASDRYFFLLLSKKLLIQVQRDKLVLLSKVWSQLAVKEVPWTKALLVKKQYSTPVVLFESMQDYGVLVYSDSRSFRDTVWLLFTRFRFTKSSFHP